MRVDVRQLSRNTVSLARMAPELIPSFVWLMVSGYNTDMVRTFRSVEPTPEELAGVMACIGEPAREVLSKKKLIYKRAIGINVPRIGILAIRREALRRLGVGIESFAFEV